MGGNNVLNHPHTLKSMVNNIANCWLYDVAMSYRATTYNHSYNKASYKSTTFSHLLSISFFIFIAFV
jgi:hypothetical protein